LFKKQTDISLKKNLSDLEHIFLIDTIDTIDNAENQHIKNKKSIDNTLTSIDKTVKSRRQIDKHWQPLTKI